MLEVRAICNSIVEWYMGANRWLIVHFSDRSYQGDTPRATPRAIRW